MVRAGVSAGKGHTFLLSGEALWCSTCGAFAETHAMAPTKPCLGKPVLPGTRTSAGQVCRNGRRRQLHLLEKRMHPRTRARLPPPVSIYPNVSSPDALIDEYRPSPSGAVFDAGRPLDPVMQATLERVRKRQNDSALAARCVRRRLEMRVHSG